MKGTLKRTIMVTSSLNEKSTDQQGKQGGGEGGRLLDKYLKTILPVFPRIFASRAGSFELLDE
jgi:hypothetical protein